MWFLTQLAEQRIEEARDHGELDNLPGAGQPLQLDDDPLVPEHERMAYRILKNSGYLPPELEMHKEAVTLALQLAAMPESERLQDRSALARFNQINLYLAETGHRQWVVPLDYAAKLAAKLGETG